MKVAIHHNQNSFSDRWIYYCEQNRIKYKIVNCYSNDIISQISDCNILLWHHDQNNHKEILFAKQLLFALEHSGKKVFPDFKTNWHFDDKLGQKYLFESLKIPSPNTYIFYEKKAALCWAAAAAYPKIFKLRSGAGSENVKMINSFWGAKKSIKKAFRKGFRSIDYFENLKERIDKFKDRKAPLTLVMKGIVRLFFPSQTARIKQREKGYIYLQDFIPGNDFDIRVIVIAEKAIAIKRMVRKNDFRASGSGIINYEPEDIDTGIIKMAFDLTSRIKAQCVAYDFIIDKSGVPRVLEISYGFWVKGYRDCKGYWDTNLKFHKEKIFPEDWILECLIKETELSN